MARTRNPPKRIIHFNIHPDIWRKIRDGFSDHDVLYADHNTGDLIVKMLGGAARELESMNRANLSYTLVDKCMCRQCTSIIRNGVTVPGDVGT